MNAALILKFLKDIAKNNNRDWFEKNKEVYLEAKSSFEDFLEDLAADIDAFETAIANQSDAIGGHVAAGEALDDLFDDATELQKKLDGFMRNKFANNAEVLAEWTRASHVERAPKRKKTEGGSTPSTPTA